MKKQNTRFHIIHFELCGLVLKRLLNEEIELLT